MAFPHTQIADEDIGPSGPSSTPLHYAKLGPPRYREAHLMAQYRAPMWTWLLLVVALLLIFGRCSDGDHQLSNHGQIAVLRLAGAAS